MALRHVACLITVLGALAGCTGWTEDGGLSVAQDAARQHLGKDLLWQRSEKDEESARVRVKELLADPLTPDSAVQIALLNNRGLQAAYEELGIAEAEFVQATRLPNPKFSFARLSRAGSAAIEIERSLTFNVLGIVTMPIVWDIETRRFEAAKQRAASDVLRLAYDTRRAFFAAVAAQEVHLYAGQAREAAEAGAELARRMRRTGSFSRLQEARERLFHAAVAAQYARARQAAGAEREKLTRLLGLWGNDLAFKLPERLPALPQAPRTLENIEATGLKQRFDIQIAQRDVEGLAKSLGLTRSTGFVNVLEYSALRNKEPGEARRTGYEIEVSIPIFDFGDAKMARAERLYRQGANRLAEIAINARSQLRETYGGYRDAWDLAKHYQDEVVPLAKIISEETLLRYNGMLVGTHELLTDMREQIQQVTTTIEALRDFWIAEADLDTAMTIGGEARGPARASRPAAPSPKVDH
jgi:outer membrane protein TolC